MKLKVAVVGATGYTGEEIIKCLSRHKEVEITSLSAIVDKPASFSDMFPAYKGMVDIVCGALDADDVSKKSDLVFLALPHRVSMKFVPLFLAAGKKVVDLSADYRLDEETYAKWYEHKHTDVTNIGNAVYGLPELYRERIKKANLIANPGCYPTAMILAAVPAVKAGLVKGMILVDAKSGTTGAGRKASVPLSFAEVSENLKAYKIGEHQHMPEMEKILSQEYGKKVSVHFTPHLMPIRRGILSTLYINLAEETEEAKILDIYKKFYKSEPFVRVCDKGRLPEIKDVLNANYCDIGLKVNGKLLVVVSCIDNLLKGAAGQAVQNMNIMCGFSEKEGLSF